ncbi:MAG: hypothetical protein KBC35_00965 [Candidatus Pacebacteria bacterium]|nr:hypothetical protein [Candidatus Paceibacterota bacterium]
MKKIKYLLLSVLLLPASTVLAADSILKGGGGEVGDFMQNVLKFINNFIIPFIIGIGFLLFVWGMFQYFIAGGANDEAKEKGKSLMIYSTLGFVLIIIFWGVVNMLATSVGLDEDFDTGLVPSAPSMLNNGAAKGT